MDRVVCEGSEDKFPRRVAFKVRWIRKLSNSALRNCELQIMRTPAKPTSPSLACPIL